MAKLNALYRSYNLKSTDILNLFIGNGILFTDYRYFYNCHVKLYFYKNICTISGSTVYTSLYGIALGVDFRYTGGSSSTTITVNTMFSLWCSDKRYTTAFGNETINGSGYICFSTDAQFESPGLHIDIYPSTNINKLQLYGNHVVSFQGASSTISTIECGYGIPYLNAIGNASITNISGIHIEDGKLFGYK